MQVKLKDLGDLISKYATYASVLIFVIMTVYQMISIAVSENYFVALDTFTTILDNLQITIALLIVCVPEGLPLAVSMSMAFSIEKLIEDNLLMKNIEALEISGSVLEVLTGKTSTLTNGELQVK